MDLEGKYRRAQRRLATREARRRNLRLYRATVGVDFESWVARLAEWKPWHARRLAIGPTELSRLDLYTDIDHYKWDITHPPRCRVRQHLRSLLRAEGRVVVPAGTVPGGHLAWRETGRKTWCGGPDRIQVWVDRKRVRYASLPTHHAGDCICDGCHGGAPGAMVEYLDYLDLPPTERVGHCARCGDYLQEGDTYCSLCDGDTPIPGYFEARCSLCGGRFCDDSCSMDDDWEPDDLKEREEERAWAEHERGDDLHDCRCCRPEPDPYEREALAEYERTGKLEPVCDLCHEPDSRCTCGRAMPWAV